MDWKSYEKLLITEFVLGRNSSSRVDAVNNVPHLIDKDMIRELISKMKNRKAAGPSGLVSEMIKSAGGTGFDRITDLVNKVIVGVILAV